MKYILRQNIFILFLVFAFSQSVNAQLPDCNKYYHMFNGTFEIVDPATNTTTINSIALPSGSSGLAVADNFFSSTPSPTYYTTVNNKYYYYDGSTWINTGHSTGSSAVNPGGAGPYIYNLDGSNSKLYRYDGTGPDVLFLNLGSFAGPYDVMGDADGNVYVLVTSGNQALNMYDTNANLVCSYDLVNMPNSSSGGGYSIVNGVLYVASGAGYFEGTISGNTITFTPSNASGTITDMANCAFPPINLTIAAPDDLSCGNTTIELSSTTSITNPIYSWSGPGIVSGGNTANPIVDQPGTYTLTITSSGGGCAGSSTQEVEVEQNGGLSLSISATETDICSGEPSTLTVTAGSGTAPYTYSWDNSLPDGNSNTVSPTTTTTYTCTVSDDSGCTGTISETINVTEAPSIDAGPDRTVCEGGSITLTASNPDGATITWNPSVTDGQPFTPTATETYTLTGDLNGCITTDEVTVTLNSVPTFTTNTTDPSCGQSGEIEIVPGSGANITDYSIDNGATTQSDGTFTNLNGDTYDIIITDANGCEATGTETLNSSNGPSIDVISSTDVSCFGENDGSAEIDVTGGVAPYTHDWAPVGGDSIAATDLAAGTYTVSVTDDIGCQVETQIIISEPDEIIIDETITNADCGVDNGEIALDVTGGSGNYTTIWVPNVSNTNEATDLAVGDYEVTVTDDDGCSKTDTFPVIVGNSFYIEAVPDSVTISAGGSVDLHVFIDPNIAIDSIAWTPSNGLSCTDCKDPIATPDSTTNYIVKATDEDGCTSTDTVKITVIQPCGDVFVPNTFSPNEDGLNDLQCVLGDCIISLDFTIFDRWGEAVFSTKDQKECWDGTFRGKVVQSGVYIYKLKAVLESGSKVKRTGNITVVK